MIRLFPPLQDVHLTFLRINMHFHIFCNIDIPFFVRITLLNLYETTRVTPCTVSDMIKKGLENTLNFEYCNNAY